MPENAAIQNVAGVTESSKKSSGTITSYNEKSGKWEVKNNAGQVVATASNLHEASVASKEYIYGGKEGTAFAIIPQEVLAHGGTYAVPGTASPSSPQPAAQGQIGEWVNPKTGPCQSLKNPGSIWGR